MGKVGGDRRDVWDLGVGWCVVSCCLAGIYVGRDFLLEIVVGICYGRVVEK